MRALEIITGHVIDNPAYTYKLQLKTTLIRSEKRWGIFAFYLHSTANFLT